VRRSSGERYPWLTGLEENLRVVVGVVVVVFLIVRPFLFQSFFIPSQSMEPTLMGPSGGLEGGPGPEHAGDRIIADRLLYLISNPSRGDIAVFKAPPAASPEQKEFIKRVIGLPGETVLIVPPHADAGGRTVRGHVEINGKPLPEPYIATPIEYEDGKYAVGAPLKLGPNEYFMMGDNRNNSADSHVWGALTRNRFIGRAEIVFWPIDRIHVIDWWLIEVLGGAYLVYLILRRLLGGRPQRPTPAAAGTTPAPVVE
jgi:signal peptidase I